MKRLKKLSALLIASSLACSLAHAMHQDPHGGREVEDGSKSRTSPPPELRGDPQDLNRLFPSTHHIKTILAQRNANASSPSLFTLMKADEKRHFLMRKDIISTVTSPDLQQLCCKWSAAWDQLMRAAEAQERFDPETYATFRQEPVRQAQEYIEALKEQYRANPQKLQQTAALQFPKDVKSNANPDLPLPLPLFLQFATKLPQSPLLFQTYPALGHLNALLNEPVVFASHNLQVGDFIDDEGFSTLMSDYQEMLDLEQAAAFGYLWNFRVALECHVAQARKFFEAQPKLAMAALTKTLAIKPYIEQAIKMIEASGTAEEARAAVQEYVESSLSFTGQVHNATLHLSDTARSMGKTFDLLTKELKTLFDLIEQWQPGLLTEILQIGNPSPTSGAESGLSSPQTISSPSPTLDTSPRLDSPALTLSATSSAARSPMDDSPEITRALAAIEALPDDPSVYAGTKSAARAHRKNARSISSIFKKIGLLERESRIENTPMTLTGRELKDFLREKLQTSQASAQLAVELAFAKKSLEEMHAEKADAASTSAAPSSKMPQRK